MIVYTKSKTNRFRKNKQRRHADPAFYKRASKCIHINTELDVVPAHAIVMDEFALSSRAITPPPRQFARERRPDQDIPSNNDGIDNGIAARTGRY